jgi:hypothetical protein
MTQTAVRTINILHPLILAKHWQTNIARQSTLNYTTSPQNMLMLFLVRTPLISERTQSTQERRMIAQSSHTYIKYYWHYNQLILLQNLMGLKIRQGNPQQLLKNIDDFY